MSRPSTLHKPPWTSKVSSFLYLSPIPHPLDGILRHASSLDDARVTTTSTCTREDGQGARGMEPVKAEAWKRRRKKSKQSQGTVLPLGQAVLPPLAQAARTRTTPAAPEVVPTGTGDVGWPNPHASGSIKYRPKLPLNQAFGSLTRYRQRHLQRHQVVPARWDEAAPSRTSGSTG